MFLGQVMWKTLREVLLSSMAPLGPPPSASSNSSNTSSVVHVAEYTNRLVKSIEEVKVRAVPLNTYSLIYWSDGCLFVCRTPRST